MSVFVLKQAPFSKDIIDRPSIGGVLPFASFKLDRPGFIEGMTGVRDRKGPGSWFALWSGNSVFILLSLIYN